MADVIILGGGLSGLSAAVELATAGKQSMILEQHRYCGGRAYSFRDAVTKNWVDNGQHVLMGCYAATRRYLEIIGAEQYFELQPSLKIPFFHPGREPAAFQCPRVPAPLHVLAGLFQFSAVPFVDRVSMTRVAADLAYSSAAKEQYLDTLSAEAWLKMHGQSDMSRKYLWDVITVGALNNLPQHVSALLLFRVLRAAFLGKRENTSLLLPRRDLQTALIQPAIDFIERHGGMVRTGAEVRQLKYTSGKIDSVQLSDGTEYSAPQIICTLPWFRIKALLHTSRLSAASILKTKQPFDWSHFSSSPILAVHLWLDAEIMTEPFAASIGTNIQWVFNRNMLVGKQQPENVPPGGQQVSLVISGAKEYTIMSKEEILVMAAKELCSILPRAQSAKIVHAIVVKEKRATFSPVPGLEGNRPQPQTAFSNFFLAGDWTATGYPATIEGAVLSGQRAAALV